jgi:hypothetical protein
MTMSLTVMALVMGGRGRSMREWGGSSVVVIVVAVAVVAAVSACCGRCSWA